MKKLRPVLFWDTEPSSIEWQRQYRAVIRRVFERGNAAEKQEIIRFYGKDKVALGTSYYVGSDSANAIKVDVYYTDAFIRPLHQNGLVRLAHQEDIIAMKLEIIGRSGRKKDFWDIHALHSKYDVSTMIRIYKERYPYNHSESEIRNGFTNFSMADEDFDPICLNGISLHKPAILVHLLPSSQPNLRQRFYLIIVY